MDRYTAAFRRTEDWSGLSFGRTTARLLSLKTAEKTAEPLVRDVCTVPQGGTRNRVVEMQPI